MGNPGTRAFLVGVVALSMLGFAFPSAAQTVPGQVPPMPTDMGDLSSCPSENVSTYTNFTRGWNGRWEVRSGRTVYYAEPCNDKVAAALDFIGKNHYGGCSVQMGLEGTRGYIRGVSGCTYAGPPGLQPGARFAGSLAQGIAQRYAPAVYLNPGEVWQPSSIDFFAQHVRAVCGGRIVAENITAIRASDLPAGGGAECFLTPKVELNGPYDQPWWLRGQDPSTGMVPVYVFIYTDARDPPSEFNFIAQYMMFFPYNYGKNVCMGLAPNDHCITGGRILMGHHVGDWEVVTIRFVNALPKAVHVGSHGNDPPETGATYFCCSWADSDDPSRPALEWMGEHPIVYAADGSHGVYGFADRHNYKTLDNGDRLNDYTGRGVLWRTWDKMEWSTWTAPWISVLINDFQGRWGSPHLGKDACTISGMSGFCGIAGIPGNEYQLNDGPNMPDRARDREFVMATPR